MAKATDFTVGDYVEHMNGDTGRVTDIASDGAVRVRYERGKGDWTGEYDEFWFRLHPDGLKKIPAPERPANQ